jgi:hypothetical protein
LRERGQQKRKVKKVVVENQTIQDRIKTHLNRWVF